MASKDTQTAERRMLGCLQRSGAIHTRTWQASSAQG
jgi:hypothetical protein